MKIADFMKNPKNFLVYCGCPGIGKTFLCSCLTGWAMETFGTWRYWTENELLKKLRDSMDSMKGDYLDTLKYLIDDDLIILDDVGSGVKSNEWREEILFNVIDNRYSSMKPTIITTNYSQQDFLTKYHPRIHSRIFSIDNTIIEISGGVDFRLQNIEEIKKQMQKEEYEKTKLSK